MRESIGGAWLFGIVIVFIFLFSAFLTYSVSYTKAFNVKNEVINYIETMKGYSVHDSTTVPLENADYQTLRQTTEGRIHYLVTQVGYDNTKMDNMDCPIQNKVDGVCIIKYCPVSGLKDTKTYYKVTSYIFLEIPIIGAYMTIPITGETTTIYEDIGGFPCTCNAEGAC